MKSGRIYDIQRFSLHDGPGIRTTVFLKGCPLRCRWCHNPEGISSVPLLSFVESRCLYCGACVSACPCGAHEVESGRHVLNRAACNVCGVCVNACPGGALELVGRAFTVEEVLTVVERDRPFYRSSGGGMTLSGGEPTFQMDFAVALCERARSRGIHCVVETCGYAAPAQLENLARVTDLFLFDLKETDPRRHEEYTGVPLAPILANLRHLCDRGAAIHLRLPLIPGVNDRLERIVDLAKLVQSLPNLGGVALIPYHPMGRGKLKRFGLENRMDSPPLDSEGTSGSLARWIRGLGELGVPVLNSTDMST